MNMPCMQCRAMQALYLLALEPIAETTGDSNSYGFRSQRSTADAIEHCFKVLSRKQCSPLWILEGDIKACFDRISHEWLLEHIPMNKTTLKKWLKAGFLEKTGITHLESGFDFLGQNVGKDQGKLLLNPKIRGWADYHRHVPSKKTFCKVDHAIFQTLWQWAKRRHPNKKAEWVKKKYFKTIGDRNWVCFGDIAGKQGQIQEVCLFSAGKMPFDRHTKIRGEANPYDPQWETYFEQRLEVKWLQGPNRRRLIGLWKEQNGTCRCADVPPENHERNGVEYPSRLLSCSRRHG